MLELTPLFDHTSKKPLYIQLCNFIKQEITTGRIASGEKLPSKRAFSAYLGLSLNTIQSAYDQLAAEGYIESLPRKGIYVTRVEDDLLTEQIDFSANEKNKVMKKTPVKFDFSSGQVDLEHFPYSIWKKLSIQSLYDDQNKLLNLGHPQGELTLRSEISKYLFESRGVRCHADQIVIGAGTQFLLSLLFLIIGKDQTYAVENPGFHRVRSVLKDQGVKLQPISLDNDGISIGELTESEAGVVYVTPSHQFPYGMVMPISRRMELLKWAQKRASYIIEDDYDGEYRYKGKPIPSLQGLDRKGRVIYLGTFSKSLIPSIRISYLVLPDFLAKRYQDDLTIYKQTVSRLHQDTLFRFMNQGYWQSHLNKMRTLYRKKQAVLLSAIHHCMGEKVTIIGETSGLHILIKIASGWTEMELIEKARESGVKVYPVSIYYEGLVESRFPTVLLGFGGLSITDIEEGIRLLKEAWEI